VRRAAPVQSGEVLAGKYRVEEVLGSGGMGVVVAAVHLQLGRRVALKFMLPDGLADPETVERFSREACAAVQLRSEHVARIIDVDELDDGRPYIVMEYLEGTDLATVLQAEKALPVPTVADYVIQALDALAEAHALGIVHRDLKPRNLFLARRADGSALVKVLDFGISKVSPRIGAPSLTQTQSLIGSPAYMSPEQLWSSKLVDVRSDIWSLGVILYELVSGHLPFGASTFSSQVLKVVLEPLPPIDAPGPVPDEFEAVVERCLAKDPAHRFENVAQLAGSLEPLALPSAGPIVERIRRIVSEAPAPLSASSVPDSVPSALLSLDTATRASSLGSTATLAPPRFAQESMLTDGLAVVSGRRSAGAGRRWKFVALGAALAVIGGGAAALYGMSRESHERLLRLYVEQGRAAVVTGDSMRGLAYLGAAYRDGARGEVVDVLLGSAARALGGELLVLHDPDRILPMPEFSPDGRQILTNGDDGVSQLWDASTGALLTSIPGTSHRGWFVDVDSAFSPDSSRIAVRRAGDRDVDIRDARTGDLVYRLSGHADEIMQSSFSPDGRRILTSSRDGSVRIWSAGTGAQLLRLAGAESIASAVWRPDGTRVAAGTTDGTLLLWDASTGRLVGTWKGHDRSVQVRFSPDGTRLATASWDGKVRIWDPDAGESLVTLNNGSAATLGLFFPDGRRLVSAGAAAKVWDVQTGALLYTLEGHRGSIQLAQVSTDGTRILTTGGDETARLWDARDGELLWTYVGVRWSASLDRSGKRVIAALTDGTARVWDAHRTAHDRVLRGHRVDVRSARFSPDGTRILTASSDRTIKLWETATGRELASTAAEPSKQGFVAWSPDGARFLTIDDRTAKIWDVRTMRPVLGLVGHTAPLWPGGRAGFSTDGRKVVTASEDRTARIWDATTGRELLRLEGHQHRVNAAEFSPDGAAVVTACEDGTARVWSAATGRVLATLEGHAEALVSATFDRSGTRILTTSSDRTAKIWDARTGSLLLSLEGHTQQVNRSDFQPGGALIVTSSIDGTARLWDSRDGRLLGTIATQPWIGEATFSPDGKRVLTASNDGTARTWEVPAMPWTEGELDRFLRCRVPFRFEKGRLSPARTDPALCKGPVNQLVGGPRESSQAAHSVGGSLPNR
jgi:WD40 repeat protein/serine/threonine protein kinase